MKTLVLTCFNKKGTNSSEIDPHILITSERGDPKVIETNGIYQCVSYLFSYVGKIQINYNKLEGHPEFTSEQKDFFDSIIESEKSSPTYNLFIQKVSNNIEIFI